MDPAAPNILDPDAKTKILSFPNGALKKPHHHHHHHHHHRPPPVDLLYRECLKNHAASLGGHAVDGCGEFMPSPAANPADPTSLTCAACGCHRNFHRRLPDPLPASGGEASGEDSDDDDADDDARRRPRRSSNSPQRPLYLASSAPHMLMALSAGLSAPPPGPDSGRPISPAAAPGPSAPRKRFRSKFSPEQKGRMLELSERLGWRMQKRDEGLVEECCREIGIGKGVFKVWMHNNKQNYLGGARRGEAGGVGAAGNEGSGGGADGGATEDTGNGGGVVGGGGGNSNGNGNGNGNGHAVNGSSPSP